MIVCLFVCLFVFQQSLEMQTFNEDLKKRASVLAKERAIYQVSNYFFLPPSPPYLLSLPPPFLPLSFLSPFSFSHSTSFQRQKEQLQSLVVSYVREKGGENSDSTLKQQVLPPPHTPLFPSFFSTHFFFFLSTSFIVTKFILCVCDGRKMSPDLLSTC